MRRFHALSILCAIVIVAAWVSGKLAERLGTRIGAALDRTLGGAWRATLPEPEREPTEVAPARAATFGSGEVLPRAESAFVAKSAASSKRGAASPTGAPPQRGLRISAATVLHLARSGARPAGTPVPPSGGCPAGLRLSGVGALGVGLRDGDVLTRAGGRPATSRADVVGVVIAARGAHQREISGRVCRAGELYNLVVDQPYLE